MTGWVLRITKMMSEALLERLVIQVFWRWPKKLFFSIIGKRRADRVPALVLEKESNSPSSQRATDGAAPAAMGPQHDASNYRLCLIGGAYVYEFHADPEDGHDSCWACQKCFDEGRVCLLQPDFSYVEIDEYSTCWTCSGCDRSYLIHHKELPPNW